MANAFELLSNLRENLPADTPENQNEREKLLHELRSVFLSLERQDNAVERISFQVIPNLFHAIESPLPLPLLTALFPADGNCCLQNWRGSWDL